MDIFVIILGVLTAAALIAGLYIFTYDRKRRKVWLPLLLVAGILFAATIMWFTYTFSVTI